MKVNLPVTGKEIDYAPGLMLVSKTDLKGVITYANQDFIELSGFSERELIGASHNIVRHPDMPPEAFADLWKTLKSGLPWTGFVKNRCKSGDFYWVMANVTPISEGGKVVGYMSVRSKPTREQVSTAENAYRLFREKRAKGLSIHEGHVVTGIQAQTSRIFDLSLKLRLAAVLAVLAAATVIGGVMGLYNLERSHEGIRHLYEHHVAPLGEMQQLAELMPLTRQQLLDAQIPGGPTKLQKLAAEFADTQRQKDDALSRLAAVLVEDEDKALFATLSEHHKRLDTQGLQPALHALQSGDLRDLPRLLKDVIDPGAAQVKADLDQLAKAGQVGAKEIFGDSKTVYAQIRVQTYLGVSLAVLIALILGYLLIRSTLRPLSAAIVTFHAIAEGNYKSFIPTGRKDEIGKLLYALKAMQIRLGFDVNDAIRAANESTRIKVALDCVTTNVMIGDNNGDIIYMNKAIHDMFRAAQTDIQRDLPHFNAETILGTNFDVFHKHPAHQRGLIQSLKATHRATVLIGGRTFRLTANPVINDAGQRLGTSVEWIDATQEVRVENQVKEIVGAAANGDFSRRLSLDDKQGFMKDLSQNINLLLTTSEEGLREVLRVLAAISSGDLSQTITSDYRGTFGELKDYCNNTVAVLGNIVTQLEHAVREANAGNFKVSVDTQGMQGFQTEIGNGVNSLMRTSDTGLGEVLRVLAALAKGDLTEKISNDYQGTFGMLKDYSNTTVENLKQLVGQIARAVDSITTASGQISAGNQDLSQRTEEQAASLEETASSMEELTSTVKLNADNAKEGSELAGAASDIALKGGDVVKQSVQTMAKITESSRRISDIIGVIDGIAFQTNILALNAAVEAARAGEQGRGFAVVAGEVRNLAQRSATAAKEIKDLITDSVSKVESGTAQVNAAGHTMEEIVHSISKVTNIMAGISAASLQQSAGIEHVNIAITQMDEVTQQNAALVEQAAAAAESLHDQAVELSRAVSVFKLDTERAGKPVRQLTAR